MYLAELMIEHCIKQRNLTNEEIGERLEFLRSIDDERFFPWETFELIRNGSRVFANQTEATAMAMIVDPHETVVKLGNWHIAFEVDARRFKQKNNNEN